MACMKATQLFFISVVLTTVCVLPLQSQVATNAPAQSAKRKPRPLTEGEANEVRSHNLDPTGMMIEADLPITRLLTPEELQSLENHGIDSSAYKGKPVTLANDEERAAMEQLISKGQQSKNIATPADLKNAYIWMDNFMGMTNADITADVIIMKTDSLKFCLSGQIYDYSGHYTVMLNTPRQHKGPYIGLGIPETASLVILENVGTDSFPLTNAIIFEKSTGFIGAVADGKEWIHSGGYTIRSK
jgi:hypothetical protein